MIDDKQTCDVCGEDFNEDRPHHKHRATKKSKKKAPQAPATKNPFRRS
ncbi:hypothetical protein HY479_01805 [Candidatus Uhrbacteria bacterium]|nr:hypothetical protein [Candidatus Uhrbacteria bacterium]